MAVSLLSGMSSRGVFMPSVCYFDCFDDWRSPLRY